MAEKINKAFYLGFGFISGGTLPLKHNGRRFWLVPTIASHSQSYYGDYPLPIVGT